MMLTRRVRRIAALGLVGSVSLALLLPQQMPTAAADPEPTPVPSPQTSPGEPWLEPTGTGLVRPDWLSASVSARASGQRVEVLSERTGSVRRWVLSDGSVEVEESLGAVRFEDAKAEDTDKWRDIDTSLVAGPGNRVVPKAVPGEFSLSGGGSGADLVSLTGADGGGVELGSGIADVTLPEPQLNGSTATYSDVLPGVDLSVEVRSDGFEQLWVVKDETGLQNLIEAQAGEGGDVSLTAALQLDDLTSQPQPDGTVEFNDDDGQPAGVLGAPVMWDGEIDPSTGEPANIEPVDFEVTAGGEELTPADPAETGDLELTVTAGEEWLTDPVREFPITIDPTYLGGTAGPTFDTFVQETYSGDYSNSDELKLGTPADGATARTYMNFSTSGYAGKTITAGSLSLYNSWSSSCTAEKSWSAWNAGTATTASTWGAQPWTGTKYASSTQAKGGSCSQGTVSIDMKTQLQLWADETSTTRGLRLGASDESDTLTWKRFHSSQGVNKPVLRWSYNRAPAVSQAAQVDPVAWYSDMPYTATRTPKVTSAAGSDADNNTIRVTMSAFSSQTAETGALATCNSSYVAPSSTVACTFTTALPSNSTVWLKSRSWDGFEYSRWTVGREVRVADVTPTAPVISCPSPYSNNSWQATAPSANVTCTITAAGSGFSAPSTIRWQVDGGTWTNTAITQSTSTGTAKTTVSVPKALGGHRIAAHAVSPSGKQSPLATHSLGWGSASLTAPLNSPRQTTTDTVTVTASGPPKGTSTAPTAKIRWRVAGSAGTSGWVDAPAANTLAVSESGGATVATGLFSTASVVGLSDGAGVVVAERRPTLLEVQVCLAYTGGTQCTPGATVLRVPHAFGNNYPTQEAGPGQVALWTGELSLADTDAALPAPAGDISVSRSHTSFAGPAAPHNQVFGPGWTASFDDGIGLGGNELLDGTALDGTLALVDADGEALIFTTPTGQRRTNNIIPTGKYLPANENTATAGITLTVSGSGANTLVTVVDGANISTKYQASAVPVAGQDAVFRTIEVRDHDVVETTTYVYDAAGRVTSIVAPLPDGVTTCVPGTRTDGCRVLKIAYATATTATASTAGDVLGQVKSITAQVNTDTDRVLANYAYDPQGRLLQQTDTRTGLTTTYTWTGTGTGLRLVTLTPPGQAAFTFGYISNKLAKVTRPNPASAGGGTAQIAAYVYDVPVAGTNLPDMGTATAKWAQTRTPIWGAAAFGPDQPISGITPAAVPAEGWKRADLSYTDVDGYTTNTVNYGAGDWQYTANDYDELGNVVAAWDERGIRTILADAVEPGAARDYATLIFYNDDVMNGSDVVTPAGLLVTDVYSPARLSVPSTDSIAERKMLRTHVRTYYDQGAPNGGLSGASQPYWLPTKNVTTAETPDGSDSRVVDITFSGYNPLVSSDKSGWDLGQATSTTVDMDLSDSVTPGDITTRTRYDAKGRVIENRQPASDGSDAGTRRITYYSADSSAVPTCGNKPKTAGWVCQVGPVAQPSGEPLPTTSSSYTWDGQSATENAISGSVTSTSTTAYSAQDRPISLTTAVSGLPNSTAVPAVTTTYDSSGQVTGTSSSAGSVAMSYDNWGRQLTYSNHPAGQPSADTTTTTYNQLGQVTSVVDNNGSTTYTYNGTDANGHLEYRRGLATEVQVKTTGGPAWTSTGAYDHAGALITEQLPGQVTRRTTLNNVGEETGLTYSGRAVVAGTAQADQPWLAWSTESDAESNIVRESSPLQDAASQLGDDIIAADRTYAYDQAGRLTKVEDRSRTATGDSTPACTTSLYGFDANGNRTSETTRAGSSTGDCASSGGTTTTRAYDVADRPTKGANNIGDYVYDQLGRQTTVPAADAPTPDGKTTNIAYYDNGALRAIDQEDHNTRFTLDAAGRRLTQYEERPQTANGQPEVTGALSRHYTNSGDNPTWSVDERGGQSTTTRYGQLLGGGLGLSLTTTTISQTSETAVTLPITTPRGDVATVADLSAPTAAAYGFGAWQDFSAFGEANHEVSAGSGSATSIGYGWLGRMQRATLDNGFVLMGARLYNSNSGLFMSADPVYAGNSTSYTYPQDPVNNSDLTGLVTFTYYGRWCGPGRSGPGSPIDILDRQCMNHDKCYGRYGYYSWGCDKALVRGILYNWGRMSWKARRAAVPILVIFGAKQPSYRRVY